MFFTVSGRFRWYMIWHVLLKLFIVCQDGRVCVRRQIFMNDFNVWASSAPVQSPRHHINNRRGKFEVTTFSTKMPRTFGEMLLSTLACTILYKKVLNIRSRRFPLGAVGKRQYCPAHGCSYLSSCSKVFRLWRVFACYSWCPSLFHMKPLLSCLCWHVFLRNIFVRSTPTFFRLAFSFFVFLYAPSYVSVRAATSHCRLLRCTTIWPGSTISFLSTRRLIRIGVFNICTSLVKRLIDSLGLLGC